MTSTTKTSSGPTTTTANQPVPTLYLNHLDLSINKLLLRQSLYALFTPYGRIIDIVASKGPNKRGQAFIVFSEQKEATSALRGLSGKEFFGRELRIEYAKTKSQATKRVEDPFGQTGAGRGEGQDERVNEAMGSTKQKLVYSNAQEEYEALEKERAEEEEGRGKRARVEGEEGGGSEQESAGDAGEEQGEAKRRKVDQGRQGDEDEDDEEMEMDEEEETVGPSQKVNGETTIVLLASGLPDDADEQVLVGLFQQYPGFQSVDLLPLNSTPTKSASITFLSQSHAEAAQKGLDGFMLKEGAGPIQVVVVPAEAL